MKPVIRAICHRELRSWFGSPTGYVFISMFVLLAAVALVVPNAFFDNNLANLDTLNVLFSILLLFFVPAVTMGIWANEKSNGTEELLFTLPATDLQILLGKFAAAVGIYTASLLFTLTLPLVLMFLGSPDLGLVITNYLGYWLLGVLLISVAMISSQLTDNLTVSFILGALFCGIVVFSESLFGSGWAAYGPAGMFDIISSGVVPLASIVLFISLTAAFLYLNLALLTRRHWGPNEARGVERGVRFGALVVGSIALGIIALNKLPRIDGTVERLHSLSSTSTQVLDELDSERPVLIQAFISDDVPQALVETRRTVLDLLRQFDSLGGDSLQVSIKPTQRATENADYAELNFNIRYMEIRDQTGPHYPYLGLAFQCGAEEVVIPFVGPRAPVEYEITRSIRTVASVSRRKVGVLRTDADLFGGFDFQAMRQIPRWQIVSELELQYDVETVSPDEAYPEDLDALVVPMASSLTQPQMDMLAGHIRAGGPTLILDDPLPTSAPGTGPMDPKGGPQNPMMGGQPPPEQKGNIAGLLMSFGINWPVTSIAWQAFNPHPLLAGVQPELIFVTPDSGARAAFNPAEAITSGLQELVIVFGGHVQGGGDPQLTFIPLLTTGGLNSGSLETFEAFRQDMFFGQTLNPARPHRPDPMEKILAGKVVGTPTDSENGINLIFVADLDMVGSEFFYIRNQGLGDTNIQFDNVTFVLNCIDELAGDSSFIDLRKRRPRHRALERLERSQRDFTQQYLNAKNSSEANAANALNDAQRRFDERVAGVENDMGLDAQSRAIRIEEIREVENRRLEFVRAQIEQDKQREIDRAEATMNQERSRVQDMTKVLTLAGTPLPAIIVGLLVLTRRKKQRAQGGAA